MDDTQPAPVPIAGLAHIGVRVHDLQRSVAFYALLCPEIMAAKQRLEAAGIPLSGGPEQLSAAQGHSRAAARRRFPAEHSNQNVCRYSSRTMS
jgi:catechol 2,3-dioxygenase-like lactoylglutathione lyase family enzyme